MLENCKNQNCIENGWSKLKVVDVEYIGLTQDEAHLSSSSSFDGGSDEFECEPSNDSDQPLKRRKLNND